MNLSSKLAGLMPLWMVGWAVRAVYPRVEPELARLPEYMPRGGTAVDAGGWFGPWTKRLLRIADRVVTIEAAPQLAALLRRTFPQGRVIHAALSDKAGRIELRIPPGGLLAGTSSVEHDEGTSITVPAITLDSLDLDDVRFIKLDIEGHEQKALLGGERTIRRDRPVLLLELEERLQPTKPLIDLLASWGYTGYVLPKEGWVELAHFDLVGQQQISLRRVDQSFVRHLLWPYPRYVNSVLFHPSRFGRRG